MSPSPCNNEKSPCEDPKTCNKRFKGVETFLRRVAFNLGNSPSQTEVKIISCIPIDVTDLQNKIVNLERQLYEARNSKGSTKNTPVHKALLEHYNTVGNTNAGLSCQCSEGKLGFEGLSQCGVGSSKRTKSPISFLFPSIAKPSSHRYQSSMLDENYAETNTQPHNDNHHKNFFRKFKKVKAARKKERLKTQLVYYVHTENNPFNRYHMSTDHQFADYENTDVDNSFSQSYLENVFQRHFDPERVIKEFSDTSHFTSPVCRDFEDGDRCRYESDVCSSCHGQFQNIDNYMGKNQNFIVDPVTIRLHDQCKKDSYYDSKLYDIIPVKEKPLKSKEQKLPKKELKTPADMRCWVENTRTKPRFQSTAANIPNNTPAQYNTYRRPTYRQKTKSSIRKESPNRFRCIKIDKTTGITDTYKSYESVDCGEIYPKPLQAELTLRTENSKLEPMRPTFRNNAECLTIGADAKKLTITRSIQIDMNSVENRTEETLNQIKSILQSVLTEVKTNPQINNLPVAKPTKDAVVQNGTSQSNIQTCSSLLHSFTYNNSYNANPYLPSCSHQGHSNFRCTNFPPCQPLKCIQNFPLLIQTPGHPTCGCFYKYSGHASRPIQKQAATTATNTEKDEQVTPATETDKLIKEIYKSIALTLDSPKDTSNSEYDDLKSLTNNSSGPREIRSTTIAMADVERDRQVEVSMTPIITATVNARSVGIGPDVKRKEVNLDYVSQSTATETEVKEPSNKEIGYVASTISEHYSEEISTDAQSERQAAAGTTVDAKAKTEKGLLKRILASVFNKKKHNKRKESTKKDFVYETGGDKSDSDSEDNKTMYIEKSYKTAQHPRRQHQYRPRTYTTHRPSQPRPGMTRSPYMEQEYRRQWDERLMFQENRRRKYSSERPYSVQLAPVYWQNYEARSAVVDQRASCQAYSPHNSPIGNPTHAMGTRTSPFKIVDINGQ